MQCSLSLASSTNTRRSRQATPRSGISHLLVTPSLRSLAGGLLLLIPPPHDQPNLIGLFLVFIVQYSSTNLVATRERLRSSREGVDEEGQS